MFRKTIALILALLTLAGGCLYAEYDYDDKLTVVAMLGDSSDFVQAVEDALVEGGYLNEKYADGYFDEYTEKAVKRFQREKDYEPDGALTKIQFYWLSRTHYNDWFDTSYIVYITNGGSRYHTYTCSALKNSLELMPISINVAEGYGYLPCRRCKPLGY
ncbi:MAG: peptidoglycan-binding protein [Clostridia bacterium]|nr:peptidoglycan-binding protein [Clostridia bacterium]